MFIETERTYLRKIDRSDYGALCNILQDIEVMYAWEHSFTNNEVQEWIDKNIKRYEMDGYSYWAVIEKSTQQLIGVSGLLSEIVDDEKYLGVGYIYSKNFWHKGYALEVASACVDYAFNKLGAVEVTAQIRPTNAASIKVAEKLGMSVKKEFVKHYQGKEMPHLLYYLSKSV